MAVRSLLVSSLQAAAVCAALSAIALAGCSLLPKQDYFGGNELTNQDQVGSVHLAVLSVIPWREAQKSLAPAFEMSGSKALEEVGPITALLEENLKQYQSLTIKGGTGMAGGALGTQGSKPAAPPTTATKDQAAGSTAPPKPKLDTEKKPAPGKTESPATTAQVEKPAGQPSDVTIPAIRAALLAKSNELKLNPMLKYLAATALFQEVKLINEAIKGVRMLEGYEPYVVRLQISVMPRSRDLPVDAYTNISFLPIGTEVPQAPDPMEVACRMCERFQAECGASKSSAGCKELRGHCDTVKELRLDRDGTCAIVAALAKPTGSSSQVAIKAPIIVPLLVTDDIESALHTRSAESVRETTLNLVAALKQAGVSVNTDSVEKELQAILSRDTHGVFTIARLTENTLRVRLGAAFQAGSKYSMIARTYNVSVLLFVDSTQSRMAAVSSTRFVHAKTGQEIPYSRDVNWIQTERGKVSKLYGLSEDDVSELQRYAHINDFDGFTAYLRKIWPGRYTAGYATAIWAQLLELQPGSRYSYVRFQVKD